MAVDCSEIFEMPKRCSVREKNICGIVLANNRFDEDKASKNVKGTMNYSLCARDAPFLTKYFWGHCLTNSTYLSRCATKSS
jgi:hypothetical protein